MLWSSKNWHFSASACSGRVNGLIYWAVVSRFFDLLCSIAVRLTVRLIDVVAVRDISILPSMVGETGPKIPCLTAGVLGDRPVF